MMMFLRHCMLLMLALIACDQDVAYLKEGAEAWNMKGKNTDGQGLDSSAPAFDCRAHIREVICLVAPDVENLELGRLPDNSRPRPCLPGGLKYAPSFEAIHDTVPPLFQRMFCSLKKIYIEQDLSSSAYAEIASPVGTEGEESQGGAYLGIKESSIGTDLSFASWSTWKEQLTFGPHAAKEGLPRIESSNPRGINDLLYAHVVHEFAHLFYMSNSLSSLRDCWMEKEGRACAFSSESWAALSWQDSRRVRPAQDFAHRRDICFYDCRGAALPQDAVETLYADLDRSNFINTYATSNHHEDFADTVEIYLMTTSLGSEVRLTTPAGRVYDLGAKMQGEGMRGKRAFIESFLGSSTVLYP